MLRHSGMFGRAIAVVALGFALFAIEAPVLGAGRASAATLSPEAGAAIALPPGPGRTCIEVFDGYINDHPVYTMKCTESNQTYPEPRPRPCPKNRPSCKVP